MQQSIVYAARSQVLELAERTILYLEKDQRKTAEQRDKLLEALKAFMALDKTFSTAKREHIEEFAKSGQKMAQAVLLARDAIAEVEASK